MLLYGEVYLFIYFFVRPCLHIFIQRERCIFFFEGKEKDVFIIVAFTHYFLT